MSVNKIALVLIIPFFMCSCYSGEGNKNVRVCQALNSSISKEELIKKMG